MSQRVGLSPDRPRSSRPADSRRRRHRAEPAAAHGSCRRPDAAAAVPREIPARSRRSSIAARLEITCTGTSQERALAAHHRRRLMIADEHHHDIAVGAQAEIAAERRVRCSRSPARSPGRGSASRAVRPTLVESSASYGVARRDPRPVGLIGRRRRERRVCADRREEHEHRRRGPPRELEGVHARERELIGDVPPAERRPLDRRAVACRRSSSNP